MGVDILAAPRGQLCMSDSRAAVTASRPAAQPRPPDARVDFLIVGGGVAGLWLLDAAVALGYSALLVERDALGSGQTMAAQGIVHGGMKYALGGRSTPAAEAIAGMPARWRTHLSGARRPDLSGTRIVAEPYLLFAEGGIGRLAGLVAERTLAGDVVPLSPPPPPFNTGQRVLALDDFALDVRALLSTLAAPHAARIFCGATVVSSARADAGWQVRIERSDRGEQVGVDATVHCRRLVLAAGTGNEALARDCGIDAPMQRRPLHQVYVAGDLPLVNAHCLTGVRSAEPRLTITSQLGDDGRVVWSLGGALATSGVARSRDAQIAHARRELARCCAWLRLPADLAFASLRIERAEAATDGARRPDAACLLQRDGAFVCWPTKLTLVPALADQFVAALVADNLKPRPDVVAALPLPSPTASTGSGRPVAGVAAAAPPPPVAAAPWAGLAWS